MKLNTMFRVTAFAATLSLAVSSGALGFSVSQAQGIQPGLARLGACIAEQEVLDVVLLMDESGSLAYEVKDGVSNRGKPGADPDANRVDAAQRFIDELVAQQEATGLKSNVKIVGFGQDYKSNATHPDAYGDWIALNASTAKDAKDEISKFVDRTEEDYTNYSNALTGAYNDLTRSGSEHPCRMVVTFTDGELTSNPAQEPVDQVKHELCRPRGVTDRLRGAGITNVGIGLSAPHVPSNFALLRGVTEGGGENCGSAEPNGAFFEAQNVGGLFASFRRALSTGNDVQQNTTADQAMRVVLDDSITKLRMSVVAEDNLGPDAFVLLTAPTGETLELKQSGEQGLGGADVSWQSTSAPAATAEVTMTLRQGSSWEGPWTVQFSGYDESRSQGKVFSLIQLQPGLKITVSGSDSTDGGRLAVTDEQDITLKLSDGSGEQRAVYGEAITNVSFHPEGGQPQVLAENLDISSGSATIPATAITNLPVAGRLETVTTITTKGEPGTTLSPFTNSTELSVSLQNLPHVASSVSYSTTEETATVALEVAGPGRVWIKPGTTVRAEDAPESNGQIAVSSVHDSEDNALVLDRGEKATLQIQFAVDELAEGIVDGSFPVTISDVDKQEVPVEINTAVDATYSIPVNKAAFVGATILAMLLGLLIPLGILYLVRYFTNTIPDAKFGAITRTVVREGAGVSYDGAPKLSYTSSEAYQGQIHPSARAFAAAGTTYRVHALSLNPLVPASIIADRGPSVGPSGEHRKHRAKLPLELRNSWTLTRSPHNSNQYELTIFPGLPFEQTEQDNLMAEIARNVPSRIADLESMGGTEDEIAKGPSGLQQFQKPPQSDPPRFMPPSGSPSPDRFTPPQH
ncbi:vWA domain-containing protein [Corynebacterium mayonis]|uniref:vWA domain-containing protein n=1 Tax=Corynebacterium mayonis TaxID=3062461 RepID=UPI003140542C